MDGLESAVTQIGWPTAYTIDELVRIIPYDPKKWIGASIMPEKSVQSDKVRNDEIYAPTGMLQATVLDADPKPAPLPQARVREFDPGYFKEYIPIKESDIIRLRLMGASPTQTMTIQQIVSECLYAGNLRTQVRKESLRWQALMTGAVIVDEGGIYYSMNYGIPADHLACAPGTGSWTGSPTTCTTVKDILSMQQAFLGSGFEPGKVVMNWNTAKAMIGTTDIRTYLNGYGIKEKLLPGNLNQYGPLLLPETEWIVTNANYVTYTYDAAGVISGRVVHKFIPDNKILFVGNGQPGEICDLVSTVSLHSPSGAPTPGDFAFMIDHTRQTHLTPKAQVCYGWYGGPRIRRPDGIFVFDCSATTGLSTCQQQ